MAGAAGAAVAFTFIAAPAFAQDAGAAEEEYEAPIIVTGSRIVRDGYDAPTPLSVISGEEINTEAPANISDFVNTLPAVSGSQNGGTNSGSLSSSNAGINALNLRDLGSNRTLVLLDGRRSVTSSAAGLVDVNTFPQSLIERVEVVTGGASAAYGSDAVSGVVNFVLDRDYQGFKANYEYGVTTYGDVPNHKIELTGGASLLDDRLHIIASGEFFTQEGVDTIDRDWNTHTFMVNNPYYAAGNGQPERIWADGIGEAILSPGGLITSGPFRGTYFGAIDPGTGLATLGEFAYGATTGRYTIGGDYLLEDEHFGSNSLAPHEERIGLFGRIGYEITPDVELFAQVSWNQYEGQSFYQQTPSSATIQLDNPYLPQSFVDMVNDYNATAAPADQVSSISIGTSNAGIPAAGSDNKRVVERYLVGAEGSLDVLGGLDWDISYQMGRADLDQQLTNTWLNSRMNAMTDAVYDGGGNIVCRVNIDGNPNNDLPGCVPINRIGIGGVTDEAVDYLFQLTPFRNQVVKQEVAAFNLSTNSLFDIWAGPVSLALGGEYRKETLDSTLDPLQYEQTWLYGNYREDDGSYNVKEAYIETIVPLFDGADFNGAFRITDYSSSGTVYTYKLGLTWQVIDAIKLRGTYSRDIRAGNLLDLFASGTARTNSISRPILDSNGNVTGVSVSDQFVQSATGNPQIDPEKADTIGLGVVFTPGFLPGFAFSADYFKIDLSDAIGSLSAEQAVLFCYEQKVEEQCLNIEYEGGQRFSTGRNLDVLTIDLPVFNFASQKVSGVDFEASYRTPLGPGDLALRAVASHYIENVSDDGFSYPTDTAGATLPSWSYRLTASYDYNGFRTTIVGRGFDDGVIDNAYVVCSVNCPASSPDARTVNNNYRAGSFYLDTNFVYEFEVAGVAAQAKFAVKNVLNKDPYVFGYGTIGGNNTAAYPRTDRGLYDTLGRTFRLGVSFEY
ncbi:outer membrane receptor protein involved in Fe transport [Altererythrobacter atlanticus]|uniref:TonB-dependent receptor plug domain-containing protein n=1 Tax=Croceibacterium atlanticum TaxID=1267766 RepID=UPI0017C437EE|nr:TonB-dependent receptor [Croceibacterium atlanticum]MBB5733694.1 outer membrane receptor protein involved in Fe transport [Croceibacterium atlanticum]